jgi:quinol monooxygenase YgiN
MVVVVATMHAQEGREDKLRDVLLALVVESRLEEGCLRYDLLRGEDDPLSFALYEEWESEAALNAHLRTRHIAVGHSLSEELLKEPPRVVAYLKLEPARRSHTGPTRKLDPSDPVS